MPTAQKSAPAVRPEGDSTSGHFLHGSGYFVPMPDFSDETIWTVNQGRSLPALYAVIRALHDQHRRGRTEEIRADAREGKLTIGLKALSRANRMQAATLRHQLEFLHRAGLLNMHDGEQVIERDPKTGKILKGRGRTPPKVIIMTLDRSMMRGGRRAAETGRSATQRPEETGRLPTLSPHALRVAQRPPSIEHPTEGVPMEHSEGRGREHPAHGGRSIPPPQKKTEPAASRPAEEPLSAEEQTRRAMNRYYAGLYAKALGITYESVVSQWKSNPSALFNRLERAGIDRTTGTVRPLTAMLDGPPAPPPPDVDVRPPVSRARTQGFEDLKEGERYAPSTGSAFALRRQATAALTIAPDIAGEAAQALDGPPVSEWERKVGIIRELAQAQAGLTAGEAGAGAA